MSILPIVPREQAISTVAEASSYLDQLVSKSAPEADLNGIAEQAMRDTSGNGAAIVLEKEGEFVCIASVGDSAPAVGTVLEKNNGLSGMCVTTGSILVCDDAESDPRVDAEACRGLEIRSIATVPIIREGRSIGLLEVFARGPNAFDAVAVTHLQTLADKVAWISGVREEASVAESTILPTAEPVCLLQERPAHKKRNVPAIVTVVLAGILVPAGLLVWRNSQSVGAPVSGQKTEELLFDGAQGDAPGQNAESSSPNAGIARPNSEKAYALATAFREGRGVKQNLVEAYAWYVIASMGGSKDSDEAIRSLTPQMPQSSIGEVRYRLGKIFETGDRVPKSLETAYFWYSLSEVAQNPEASAQKEKVGQLLTDDQRRQADVRVTSWIAKHSSGKNASSTLAKSE